jgi:hypothetical protein
MQTRRAAPVAAEEAALDSASAHAVLFSQDLWHQHLWMWLDPASKAALRVVSKAMRGQVDAAVEVVASPSSGASENQLRSALLRWPAVRELSLLNVSDATALAPLSTASLAGLTSLTVSEKVGTAMRAPCAHGTAMRAPPLGAHPMRAWHGLPRSHLWCRMHGTCSMRAWHEVPLSPAPSHARGLHGCTQRHAVLMARSH